MKITARITAAGLAAALAASPPALLASPSVPSAQDVPIAMLIDATTGQVLHEREAQRRFLPASVTKVMTTYLAFELLGQGRLSPKQVFTVDEQSYKKWSGTGSSMFLQRGERVSVDQLLHGITTVSANDGCIVLAKGAAGSVDNWLKLMNDEARRLGMDNSHFGSPNGFPDEGQTFTSADDLAKLTNAMITRHPKLYARYFGKRTMSHNGYTQVNHDPITGFVEGADGIKTGYTREAGYNFLGSAKRGGRRLAIVLAGVDNPHRRARAARDYLEWGFGSFQDRPLFPAGAIVADARVQGGADRSVGLRAAVPIAAEIRKGTDPEITLSVSYRGPIKAPIAAGSRIAQLKVQIEGFEPFEIPLVAAHDVPEANFLQRILNGAAELFT